jgi:hypothetical protein
VTGTSEISVGKLSTNCLHLLVLAGFGVGQPVYEILGQNPEFLAAHRSEPGQILLVILLLSFGVGLALSMAESAVALCARRLWPAFHNTLVFVLVALVFVAPAKRWFADSSDIFVVGAAVLPALLITAAYTRLEVLRLFATALSPAILVFPLLFVFNTPVVRLVFPEKLGESIQVEVGNDVPIVLVVFDEITISSLLDASGDIDASRFPNFNRLSRTSHWFPNALAVSQATVEAVPAILTGRYPQENPELMPTAGDHPANLFTMLGGEYALHVSESVTALFDVDQQPQPTELLLSDILVLYLHLVLPPEVSLRLPPIEDRWAGFGQSLMDIETGDKADQLQAFISALESDSDAQLHFIHVLLPHAPYQHLSSGAQYTMSARLPDGLVSNADGWGDSESLLVTGYHRYLHQLAYVDQYLGELIDRMQSIGIYDEALLVVTADHGVSHQRGQSRRQVDTQNGNEILNVPLWIKLPGQDVGEIRERPVTGADILPTILDVLDADLPSTIEGVSAFSQSQTSPTIDVPRVGQLRVDELVKKSQLSWQIDNFGEHSPLDRLVPNGPHHDLAGVNISELTVGDPGGLSVKSGDYPGLREVSTASGYLPALFSGYISGATSNALPLAVTLNGVISATTITSTWGGRDNYFSVLLPSTGFLEGRNVVRVYVIESDGATTTLRPVKGNMQNVSLRRGRPGPDVLVIGGDSEIILERDRSNMNGFLERATREDNVYRFRGWAADLVGSKPASNILLFRGENLVWQTVPHIERDAIAVKFGPEFLGSGYNFLVPAEVMEAGFGEVSLIAVADERRAFRLSPKGLALECLVSPPQQ